MDRKIECYLSMIESGIYAKFDEKLARYTTVKIGGKASVYVEPKNANEVKKIVEIANNYGYEVKVISGGSNVLIADGIIDCVVMRFGNRYSKVRFYGEMAEVEAGVSVSKFINMCIDRGFNGIEFAYGVGCRMGGMTAMNFSCYGESISQYVHSVMVLSCGKIVEYSAKECDFSYRHSRFLNSGDIILSTTIKLQYSDDCDIREQANSVLAKRKASQPYNSRTFGSVFKNSLEVQAGKVIDELGLKGHCVGGVAISTVHANFIENINNGKCQEIEIIMDTIKKMVYNKYGIMLEEEVQRIN